MRNINRASMAAAPLAAAVLFVTAYAQVGRGGSEWLTARGDAQRTSWIRTDSKISVASMSKPGFELQWKTPLDNANRQAYGLGQGVTANGVTLFVPMSVVTGSSNNVYAIDNDTGYVVWRRHFDVPVTAPTPSCPGGTTSAATRIVGLTPPPIAAPAQGGGRAAQGYRSVLGEPGEGAPVDVRGRAGAQPAGAPNTAGRGTTSPQRQGGAARSDTPGRGAAGAAPQGGGFGRGPSGPPIPGAPADQFARGGFGRPSGVAYVTSSDGVLHVMGLQSGKDIQRPAPFVPANARWSDPIAVNSTLYTSTSGGCGGAPDAIWAIDLESESKPVVSWKSGGPLVGLLSFTTDGTLVAAVGPPTSGTSDGKPNAIVTLDAKTLQVKDWFSAPGVEFATGPTIFKHGDREIIAAATRDGRLLLFDAASPGGANHATPLTSAPLGGSPAANALTSWQEMTITPAPAPAAVAPTAPPAAPAAVAAPPAPIVTVGTRWILAPLAGSIVGLELVESAGTLSLSRGWTSGGFVAPAAPIVVNGVVFVLDGRSATAGGGGTSAVLHAYEGVTGKELWTSAKTMTSAAAPGSFWSAFGQVYVGTSDGTLYAFGFADERQ
jgi:outer membrane protein assembly factor BamB